MGNYKKHILSCFIPFFLLLFNCERTFSQKNDSANYSLSLKQAIDFALNNQVKVLNAILDEKAARYKVDEITGLGLPQVNGSIDVKEYIQQPTSLIPAQFFGGPPGTFKELKFGTKYNSTAGMDVSQLVFDGNYLVGLQAAKVYSGLMRNSVRRTKIETAAAVAKAYYSALLAGEKMSLLNANIERMKKLMDDTKALYENGFAEKIDFDRITVTYNNLLAEQEKFSRYLQLSYSLLKFQMGMEQFAKLSLADNIKDIALPPDTAFNGLKDFSYEQRVEFSILQSQNRLAKLDLKRQRFGYLPNLILYGNLSAQAQRNEFDFFDTGKKWYPIGIAGLRMGIPLFDGLQKNFRIRQAKISLLKNENDMKAFRQAVDMEITSAKIALQNGKKSLESQKRNMELAEDVFEIAKKKYDLGAGSSLEALNAETSLKEAQTNYYNALYDILIAYIDYNKAMGALIK